MTHSISPYAMAATAVLLLVHLSAAADNNECSVDDDCVPSSCCHASGCISARTAAKQHLDCDGKLCTAQCLPFTLDCGGFCRCLNNTCAAKMVSGVAPSETLKPEKSSRDNTITKRIRITVMVRKRV